MPSIQDLFGADTAAPLVTAKGRSVAPSSITHGGKFLGIYFSASWCPPCRRFTPELAKFYKYANEHGLPLEIVWVSSCNDQSSYREYLSEMPWLALPWHDGRGNALQSRYSHEGIPHLVFLDQHLNLITNQGVMMVKSDPTGAMFPWSLDKVLGAEFLASDSKTVPLDALKAKDAVGFYFNAKEAAGCRAFTPVLTKVYQGLQAAHKSFEVVSCSLDKTDAAFDENRRSMPWVSLPRNTDKVQLLAAVLGIETIPALVIVNLATGRIINDHGFEAVSKDKTGAKFPWEIELVSSLGVGPDINSKTTALLLLDDAPDADAADTALENFKAVAETLKATWDSKSAEAPLAFAYADDENMMARTVRQFFKLQRAPSPVLVISDIPSGVKYDFTGKKFTQDALREFLNSFLAGTLRPTPLGM